MPRPSYTTRFLAFATPTSSVLYQCPPGHRAVIRNVTGYSELSGGVAYVVVNNVLVWYWRAPGDRGFTSFETRAVLYAGEAMSGQLVTSSVMSLSVAGYLFVDDGQGVAGQLPAGRPGPPAVDPWRPPPPGSPLGANRRS